MKTIFLVLSIFFFSNTFLSAQKNQEKADRKDYIITMSRDTIYGKISGNLTPTEVSLRITFTDDKTGTKKVYKPRQIREWKHGNLSYGFESKEYRPKGMRKDELGYAVFMKSFTAFGGAVRHYEYYNTDEADGYYMTFLDRNDNLTEIVYEKFYTQLADYFSDYQELSEKIKAKKYKKTQLTQIVDEYNVWKEKNDGW
jgi:hypothetical protein